MFGSVKSEKLVMICSTPFSGHLHFPGAYGYMWLAIESAEFSTGEQSFHVRLDCWDDDTFEEGRDVYLLPTFLDSRRTESGQQATEMSGMVIRACDHVRGQYQRIGTFEIPEERERDLDDVETLVETWKMVGDLMDGNTFDGPDLSFSEDKERKYIITLV